MATTITLSVRVAQRLVALAAEAHQPLDQFVDRLLTVLTEADVHFERGLPVFRMPPNTPQLTIADVDRLIDDGRS
jgi:hypothetical protein